MKKDSTCRVNKAVFITVYVVKPRRRSRPLWNSKQQHPYSLLHSQSVHNGSSGNNRKAELLQYSQKLRASARRDGPPRQPATTQIPQSTNKIVPVRRKPKHKRTLTCLGNWKIVLLPGFLQRLLFRSREKKGKKENKKQQLSQALGNKMNAMTRSLRLQKKPEFTKKLLSAFQKPRWASE